MKNFDPIERPNTLKEIAYERIFRLLTNGSLKLDTIFSVRQLADSLEVSRTPVREALLQLSTEGYLIPIKERGFKIKEFSKKEIKDFFEARRIIEIYVIKRLIRVITDQDLQRLNDSLKLMVSRAEEKDIYGFLCHDKDFHMDLVHLYENFFLESIMENIRNLISILGQRALTYNRRPQETINEHKNILQALHQKNRKEAVNAMNYHLNMTEKYLLE